MCSFVGVDVSKKTLDFSWESEGKNYHHKINNSDVGFKQFLKIVPKGSHVVMEATGIYHLRFANFLFLKNEKISVVNPLAIKRFGQMRMRRIKTDKADAALIAEYASYEKPELWKAPSDEMVEMRQLWGLSDKIKSSKQSYANQLEAITKSLSSSKKAVSYIKKIIKELEVKIREIEKDITEISRKAFPREMEILESIPSIGVKTAAALIVTSNGFTGFKNGRNLCSFYGLTPQIYQSGTSLNSRGGITKMGNGRIRALLYMCSLTAISKNTGCKHTYERLVGKGKAKKLALVAVIAKLVRQAVALIQKDELFNEKKSFSACA